MEWDLPVYWQTVQRHMNAAGYHKCRACQRSWISQGQADRRVTFAEAMKDWPEWKLRLIHFSDESHFHQNS